MFFGLDVHGLIDQQHRNPILDAVGLVQPWVVEPVVDEQQRAAIRRADQDVQELRVHATVYGVGAGGGAAGGVATTLTGLPGPGAAPAPIAAPFCWDCAWVRMSICAFSFCW